MYYKNHTNTHIFDGKVVLLIDVSLEKIEYDLNAGTNMINQVKHMKKT